MPAVVVGVGATGREDAGTPVGVGSGVPMSEVTVGALTVTPELNTVVAVRVSSTAARVLVPTGTDADLLGVGEPGIEGASAGSEATKALVRCAASS